MIEPRPASTTSAELPYDPGFARAVARGHLSVTAAIQRGDRRTLVGRLAKKYELSNSLATMVADNELNVRAAILASVAARTQSRSARFSLSRNELLITALSLILVTWIAFSALGHSSAIDLAKDAPVFDPEPVPPAPAPAIQERLLAATRVRANETGELVEIIGPDPRSVLITYCERSPLGARKEPLQIVPAIPSSASARLGVYRNPDSPQTLFAIRIRRDRKTSRWVAGDGTLPIPSIVGPHVPPELLNAARGPNG